MDNSKMKFNCLLLLMLVTHSQNVLGKEKETPQMVKLLQKMKESGALGDIDEYVYGMMVANAKKGADVFALNMAEIEEIKKAYQSGIDSLSNTGTDSKQNWEEISKSLKECQDVIGEINKERSSWAKQNAKFVKTLTDAQKMITDGHKKLQTCKNQLDRDKEKLDDKSISKIKEKHKKEIDLIESKVTDLQREKQRLEEMLQHNLQQASHDTEKAIAKLKQDHMYETQKLKKQLGKLQQEVHGHEKIIANLKQDHRFETRTLRSDHKIILNATKEMQEDYRRKVKEMKSSLQAFKDAAKELTKEKHKLELDMKILTDKHNKIKSKHDKVLQEHDKLIEEHRNLKKQKEVFDSDAEKILHCQNQLSKLQHDFRQSSHDNEKAKAKLKQDHVYEKQKLEKQLGKLKQEVHDHEKVVANLKQDHKFETRTLRSDLKIILNSTKEMQEDYQRKVREMKSSLQAFKDAAKELAKEKGKLQSDVKKLTDTYNTMKSKYDKVLQERDQLTKEHSKLKKQKEVYDSKDTEKMSQTINMLKEEKQTLRSDINVLIGAVKDTQKECDQKVQELRRKVDESKFFQEKIKKLENDITEKSKICNDKAEYYIKEMDSLNSKLHSKQKEADIAHDKRTEAENIWLKQKKDLEENNAKISKELNHLKQKMSSSKKSESCVNCEKNVQLEKDNNNLKKVYELLASDHEKEKQKVVDISRQHDTLVKRLKKLKKPTCDCNEATKVIRDESNLRETNLKLSYNELMQKYEMSEGKLEYYQEELATCITEQQTISIAENKAKNAKKVAEIMMMKKEDKLKEQILMESNRNKETKMKLRACTEKLRDSSNQNTVCQNELARIKEEFSNTGKAKDMLVKQTENRYNEFKKEHIKLQEDNEKLNKNLKETKDSLTEVKVEIDKCWSLKKSQSECEEKMKNYGAKVENIRAKLDNCQNSVKKLGSNHDELMSSCEENKTYLQTELNTCEEKITNSEETLKIIRGKFDICQNSLAKLESDHDKIQSNCKDNKEKLQVCVKERGQLYTEKQGFESYLDEKDKEFTTTVTTLHKRNKQAIANEVYFRKNFMITIIVCVLMGVYIFYNLIRSKYSEEKSSEETEPTKNSKQNKRESKKRR